MLEEVGETVASRLFVGGSDVVPQVDRHCGQGEIRVDDDVQAIVQGGGDECVQIRHDTEHRC